MIRNITHREAGEDSKVIKVHFTESQKAVIKLVCGQQESADKPGYIPKLTYPYVKLKLVPTRITSTKKPKKKWTVLTQLPNNCAYFNFTYSMLRSAFTLYTQ